MLLVRIEAYKELHDSSSVSNEESTDLYLYFGQQTSAGSRSLSFAVLRRIRVSLSKMGLGIPPYQAKVSRSGETTSDSMYSAENIQVTASKATNRSL